MRPRILVTAVLVALGLAACDEINPGLGPYEAPGGPDVINRQGFDFGSPADQDAEKLNAEMIKEGQQREAEGLMP
mgnify:CR=1 FL=1